ncbi:metallophosphoesterase family protein [Roseovarius arcticus]|uniref:metallophosphoesterase family protein n=1 Tax=Roseovarius arcticus TaxID=2547404 RepID=UPI001110839F|nr:metallophosphoesterase [Roseovarius arcticus]
MRRVVHLSDLHFGRDRPELLAPLITAVNALEPDLVAISGDLTQRAKSVQFRAALAFLECLQAPVLVVPGNHDIPLHNPFARIVRPWRQYRSHISPQLEPSFRDDELIVLGINTVNRFTHQSGRVSLRALARIERALDGAKRRTCLIIAHHPLEQLVTDRKRPTRGAERAKDMLAQIGVDAVLSGHLHSWRAEPYAHTDGRNTVLQIHAGTGLSTRQRGEENDFNLLDIDVGSITVTRHTASAETESFVQSQTRRFILGDGGWSLV